MKKLPVNKIKIYHLVRNLHRYFGLFISPFILVYSLSALAFNHEGWLNKITPLKKLSDVRIKLDKIPYDSSDLATAKNTIRKIGIEGEIDFISREEDFISFPVNKPGYTTHVRINTRNDSVYITREKLGFIRALSFLHKMPGPHNEKIRGNSLLIKSWRVLTNVTVYLLLFLSITGVFLWYFLKIERNMGLFALVLSIFSCTGLLLLLL
jgi:hypothetical protein